MRYSAIIPAAGSGTRSGLGYNKILYPIRGKRIIDHSIEPFILDDDCEEILILYQPEDLAQLQSLQQGKVRLVQGGKDRAHSVYNGLVQAKTPFVFIHDGARPYLSDTLVEAVKKGLEKHSGIFPALLIRDSLKKVENGKIVSVNREEYLRSQTPQAFETPKLIQAYQKVFDEGLAVTDDAQVYELSGFDLGYVPGEAENIKITDPQDLNFSE